MKNRITLLIAILSALVCFGLLPGAKAVEPTAPDTALAGGNTADGQLALGGLTTGIYNSAFGIYALLSNGAANFNTGVGAGTLLSNAGDENTAIGAGALLSNTDGFNNTANGAFALFKNNGAFNTATGDRALFNNTTGGTNTAMGVGALSHNDDGGSNTAVGVDALFGNLHGNDNTAIGTFALNVNSTSQNTAIGVQALDHNTVGAENVATGWHALFTNVIGGGNVAIGSQALLNGTAGFNTAVGNHAGIGITTAHDVIAIGHPGADVNDSCFIGNIRGVQTNNANAIPVLIDSAGQLGTLSSSQRFKKDIIPMESASNCVLDLKPVTFHYKKDKNNTPQFGLIAEEVAKVNPDLVVCDKEGQIYTVRYDAVNAMLLNELIKEHKKVQNLETTVAQQQKGMEVLTAQLKEQAAQIQKVSAQLEVSKPAPKTVANK
jgi:hypothetical protein